jgi:hypothetical protein
MAVNEAPCIHCLLTHTDTETLDACMSACITDMRICGCCGAAALRLQPSASNYHRCRRRAGTNDRALALSPIVREFAQIDDHTLWLCASCCKHPDRLATFVPDMSEDYAALLVATPFEVLHTTSFIDVNYKLTTHAYGYVSGEFTEHSLLHAPILKGRPRPSYTAAQGAETEHLWNYLIDHCPLYQRYVPLRYRTNPTAITLEAPTWQHIVAEHRARDPVTDRHEHICLSDATMDVFAQNTEYADIVQACIGTVMVAADLPVNISARSTKRDILYRTMEAEVHGNREPIEVLLCPAFFPQCNGHYQQMPGYRVNSHQYLKHRCMQAFSPFTKHTPYLLWLRAIDNAMCAINASAGTHFVNSSSYQNTRDELGPGATEGEILDRLVKHRVSETVDGSPAYFKRGKQDLNTMVRELGLPSHFITLTMNETGPLRGIEYSGVDEIMKHWNAAFDWKDAPVECNRAFIARFEYIFHQHILHGSQVLGPVSDYAIRYECQGRGSLHVHMCIWLPNSTAIALLDERICAFVPAAWDPTANKEQGAFVPPTDPLLHRLYQHVIHKQQHTCRHEDGSTKSCIRDGYCRLHFPQPLHESRTPVLGTCKRRYQYACYRECDRWTVAYLPDLALLLDAHVNVAKVVAEEWSFYLLKYATKPDPNGSLHLTPPEMLSLGFQNENVYSRAVAVRFATTQIYQPAQLALIAMDAPTFRTSRKIQYVNIMPPESRLKRIRSMQRYASPRADDQQAYEQRPTWTVDNVVMPAMICCNFHRRVQCFSRSQLNNQSKVVPQKWAAALAAWNTDKGLACRAELCPVNNKKLRKRFIGVSRQGLAYFWRPKQDLVRFPVIDPRKNIESFCYILLCEHCAFDTERSFKLHYPTYALAAYHLGLVDTFDKLQSHVARHIKYMYASKSLTVEHILELAHAIMLPAMPAPSTMNCLDTLRAQAICAEAIGHMPESLVLDTQQHHAVNNIAAHGNRGLYIVTGGAGTGKSLIARCIAHKRAQLDGVVYMATTHKASHLLSQFCDTVHSTCNIPAFGTTLPPFDSRNSHVHALATCHTFIIDEFSQLQRNTFHHAIARIGQAQGLAFDRVLENNTIILVGDESQLPPVCRRSCCLLHGVCIEHHIAASPLFEAAYRDATHCFHLHANHRNPGFAAVLDRIRHQHAEPITQDWVNVNINCRLNENAVPVPGGRVLCSHNATVKEYNNMVLATLDGPIETTPPRVTVQGSTLGAQHIPVEIDALDDIERTWVANHEQNRMQHTALNARIRFWATADKRTGQTNATMGTVVGFVHAKPSASNSSAPLSGIKVRLDRTDDIVTVHRLQPVGKVVSSRYITAAFWPLALGYATTVHVSQGESIRVPMLIDLAECFLPGLAYTALSRTTNVELISLKRPLTVHDLRVISLDVYYSARDAGEEATRVPHVIIPKRQN